MARKKSTAAYFLCVCNDGYPASLEIGKVYRALEDAAAKSRDFVRVIDESGDDYLFPQDCFVAIDVPKAATRIFEATS